MRSHPPLLAPIAIGLIAAAITDTFLVLLDFARFDGPPLGLLAFPLVLALGVPGVRTRLRANPAWSSLVVGAAWTIAPLIDQHLTRAVVIPGTGADLVHHIAGWSALAAGAALQTRERRLAA